MFLHLRGVGPLGKGPWQAAADQAVGMRNIHVRPLPPLSLPGHEPQHTGEHPARMSRDADHFRLAA